MRLKTIFGLFAVFLLVSCSRGFDPYTENFYVGTKGVELEFMGGSPPDEIYEGTEFPLAVLVTNEGAFNLNGSYKAVLSYNYDPFYLSPLTGHELGDIYLSLMGKSYAYPEGDFEAVVLPSFLTNVIIGQRENPSTEFFVSVCYPYQTKLTDEVCVDTSAITQDIRQRVCNAETKVYESQGAPIAITKVEPEMQTFGPKIRPTFLITIENKGTGTVLAPVSDSQIPNACSSQTSPSMKENWNKVHVKASLSGEELVCIPEEVVLRDEQGFVRCYPDEELYAASLNYISTLVVELDYVYMTGISKEISIVKSLTPTLPSLSAGECNSWESKIGDQCVSNCELCSQGANFAFCNSIQYSRNWTCGCSAEDCVVDVAGDLLNMEVKSSDCVYGPGFCAPGTYCCVKQ